MRFHHLPEPEVPDFLHRMRRTLDAAVARHPTAVAVFHSYRGEESEDRRQVSQGWTSRLIHVDGLNRPSIDVYYDALDDDVMLLGGTQYRGWGPDDEASEQQCLDDLDRIVDDLATNLLPLDDARGRRARMAAMGVSIASLLIGVLIGRAGRGR